LSSIKGRVPAPPGIYDPKTGKMTASGQLTGDFSRLLTQKAQSVQQ
jgi:hypothetical protein